MANQSILAAFERMWGHVLTALSGKADLQYTNDVFEHFDDITTDIQVQVDEKSTVQMITWEADD